MKFLEKDLEQIIYETPNKQLRDRGLYIYGRKLRQPKVGNYGIADIVTITGNYAHLSPKKVYTATIYELKKNIIDLNALLQVCRYRTGLLQYFKTLERSRNAVFKVSIVLIGDSIETNSDFVYLANAIGGLTLYTYSYDFDGLSFKDHGLWHLNNPAFTPIRENVVCEVPLAVDDLPF